MKYLIPTLLLTFVFSVTALGQADTTAPAQSSSTDAAKEEKKPRARVSNFKIYGGLSVSKILLSNSNYESAFASGFLVGFSYKQGRYGYWEIGLNYNNSIVTLDDVSTLEDNMPIRKLDLPISAGFNLLGSTQKIVGLRLYGGIVPGFVAALGSNPFGLETSDINQFQLDGRIGLGVDVLFLFLETGYQYGFIDFLQADNSNMNQIYFMLGFRF